MSGQDAEPSAVPERLVWRAWERVRASRGAAGAGGASIAAVEAGRGDDLCKAWNRVSPGACFPAPVRAAERPGAPGGTRVPGVPAVVGRAAQAVAALALEPGTESVVREGSCRCRPGRGALGAVAACRQRCGDCMGSGAGRTHRDARWQGGGTRQGYPAGICGTSGAR